MDNLTPAQRKKNMRNIKSKDTDIELLLRKELWRQGYRYRKNYKKLPGKPDIVLTKYKIAIFCDGEFFHGKDWDELRPRLIKSSNGEYWISKISRNIYWPLCLMHRQPILALVTEARNGVGRFIIGG